MDENLSEHKKKYYQENKERIREQQRLYRQNNKEKVRERKKKWKKQNKGKVSQQNKRYNRLNKEKINKYAQGYRRKNKNNPRFQLDRKISKKISLLLKKAGRNKSWRDKVGYDLCQLKTHLESKFEPNMNWADFNLGKIHIDHIIPKSYFVYKSVDDEEFIACWSLENLQPLWERDNLNKKAKLIWGGGENKEKELQIEDFECPILKKVLMRAKKC